MKRNKSPNIIIRNKCLNRNHVSNLLKIVPKNYLSNLTIIVRPDPIKRLSRFIQQTSSIPEGSYDNQHGTINIYLQSLITMVNLRYDPYDDFSVSSLSKISNFDILYARASWKRFIFVFYHEIGHHRQYKMGKFLDMKRYKHDEVYAKKVDDDANKYAIKMIGKLKQKYPRIFNENPIEFQKSYTRDKPL